MHLAAQFGHQDQTDRAEAYAGAQTATSPPVGAVVQRLGDPDVDNHSLLFNGELDAAEYLTFYSYGLYTKRETLSNGFFRPAGDSRNIPSIYPNGFLPNIFNTGTDYSLVLGMRTSIGATKLDASYTFGSNELEFDITNTLNRSLGPSSPTDFYAGAPAAAAHHQPGLEQCGGRRPGIPAHPVLRHRVAG